MDDFSLEVRLKFGSRRRSRSSDAMIRSVGVAFGGALFGAFLGEALLAIMRPCDLHPRPVYQRPALVVLRGGIA